MPDVIKPLSLGLLVVVRFVLFVILVRRGFRSGTERLALVTLSLASTTAAAHDPAANRTARIMSRIVGASHGRLVFASWEGFLNLDTADDLVQIVALVTAKGIIGICAAFGNGVGHLPGDLWRDVATR